jgi:uncharacterized membrane protein YhaH (DUF805 family)
MNTFSRAFSFDGRIGLGEYWLSKLIGVALYLSLPAIHPLLQLPLLIALLWFLLACGTKRCHDRGNPGIYLLIPFYPLVMAFGRGDAGSNAYGLKANAVAQMKA